MRIEFGHMVNTLSGLLKVRVASKFVVADKPLRAARDQRKPCALNLDHDAMTLLERMHDARHHAGNLRWSVWL